MIRRNRSAICLYLVAFLALNACARPELVHERPNVVAVGTSEDELDLERTLGVLAAEAPEIQEYVLAEDRLEDLLSWAESPEAEELDVYVNSEGVCHLVELERRDPGLSGSIPVCQRELALRDVEVRVSCGLSIGDSVSAGSVFWETFDLPGTMGAGSHGCMDGSAVLLDVGDDTAWIGGECYELAVRCGGEERRDEPCIGGGRRVCSWCANLDVVAVPCDSYGSIGVGSWSREQMSNTPVDCSRPCNDGLPMDRVETMNEVLSAHTFYQPSDQQLSIHRTREACEASPTSSSIDAVTGVCSRLGGILP